MTQADLVDIALIGCAGFEVSDWFLRSVELEIKVSRGERSDVIVWRPEGLRTGREFAAALKARAKIIMISGHATQDGRSICGTAEEEWSHLDGLAEIGATSAVLLDTCYAAKVLPQLGRCLRSPVVGVGAGFAATGHKAKILRYKDSVTVLADVLRELCMPDNVDLSPEAVLGAVNRVNAGTRVSSSPSLQPDTDARRRLLFTHEYP
jgi:hypothetical protein